MMIESNTYKSSSYYAQTNGEPLRTAMPYREASKPMVADVIVI